MTKLIRPYFTIIGLELRKIWRAHLIQMILAAFAFLLLIRGGDNWQDYTSNGLMFMVALIGLVGFGTLSSWVFANEFTSQTFKDLLALPISRRTIIIGKLFAIEGVELLITTCELVLLVIFGWLSLHTTMPSTVFHHVVSIVGVTFVYNVLLSFLWPLVASLTKNVLLPVTLSFGTLIIAVMFSGRVIGQFIPWSIPGYLMAQSQQPSVINTLIVSVIGVIGVYGTLYVWINQDQH